MAPFPAGAEFNDDSSRRFDMQAPAFYPQGTSTRAGLWRRIGAVGLAFFLIKGMLWLAAPFVFIWFA